MASSERIKKALSYILEHVSKDNLSSTLEKMLDEAGMRFNLSPNETASLKREIIKQLGEEPC